MNSCRRRKCGEQLFEPRKRQERLLKQLIDFSTLFRSS